jgi:type VI protein secretion system component VasF
MSEMKARRTSPTRQTPVWKWLVITCVVVAAIIAGVIGSLKPNSNVALTDLNNIGELRTRFNQDKGSARLLLLVSPT